SIRGIQMWLQRAKSREMQIAPCNELESLGKSATDSRRGDAATRGGFAESKLFDAVGEQRRVAEIEVQPATVHFGQVGQQLCCEPVAASHESGKPQQELRVSQ